jgi:hypothetical protein
LGVKIVTIRLLVKGVIIIIYDGRYDALYTDVNIHKLNKEFSTGGGVELGHLVTFTERNLKCLVTIRK